MNDEVRDYVDAIDAAYRPLFDRLHRLLLEEHPVRTGVELPLTA